jgi:predicted phage tail protein
MKVVKVYGPLRKYLGQCRFEFVADTPAQAMKALCVNFPGLAQWLLDREAEGMAFRVTRGRDKITNEAPEGLVLPWSEREVFSIAPVIVGAGRGAGTILAGIALVALAIVAGPAAGGFLGLGLGLGGATGAGAAVSLGLVGGGFASAVGFLGASLIIGGVAQLISPMPSMGGLTSGKEAARLESFSFSGIVNTSKQGMAVPICYGRAFVGSAVISSGLDVDQVAV